MQDDEDAAFRAQRKGAVIIRDANRLSVHSNKRPRAGCKFSRCESTIVENYLPFMDSQANWNKAPVPIVFCEDETASVMIQLYNIQVDI